MTQSPPDAKTDRQARLAEQLRANLHRRKAQARAVAAEDRAGEPGADLPKTDLSKP
ncbi:hypothetical protein [Novosphingobium sp.]|uniref:hypothetical protein n=1 Tax=Novosphingobium sp. TaxID=1874826 RepID=UPI003B519AD0